MIPGEETHAKRHAHCMHIKCAWKVNRMCSTQWHTSIEPKKNKGRKRIEAAPKMAIPSVEPIGSDWNRPNCLEFLSHWP